MPPPSARLDRAGASVLVYDEAGLAADAAASMIADAARSAIAARGLAVLGLATGSTPVPVYARLVAMHRAGNLSFADVITYNLDEYYPISPADPASYRAFMHGHLFAHVDIRPDRAHLPDGTVPEAFVADHAAAYERWMAADGGVDLQLLGIGRNGHIAFNEPTDLPVAEALRLPSRRVDLHPGTIAANAADFGGDASLVPRRALTVGIAPILAARSILVLAVGPSKATIVARCLDGPITPSVPGSLLRHAAGPITWILDRPASEGLLRG